jgi:hypothetical protein
LERSLTRCLSICIDAYYRRDTDETRQAKNNALHQLDLVSAERDALAMREQAAQAEKEAAIAEVQRLKALLAQK